MEANFCYALPRTEHVSEIYVWVTQNRSRIRTGRHFKFGRLVWVGQGCHAPVIRHFHVKQDAQCRASTKTNLGLKESNPGREGTKSPIVRVIHRSVLACRLYFDHMTLVKPNRFYFLLLILVST